LRWVDRGVALSADLYRMHFDVVLRKLVSEFQTGPQRVDKPTVSRFYLTVEFDDEAFVTQTSRRNTVFHEFPHQSPRVIKLKVECSAGVPTPQA
jgi:hypothetical protein